MAASDAGQRQRRSAPLRPFSYVSAGGDDKRPPLVPSPSRPARDSTRFVPRAALRVLQVALLALALFVVPACIQQFVRGLDTLYQVVGRRARTTVDEVASWSVLVGGVVLAAWHGVLIMLSSRVFAHQGQAKERSGPFSRILGRILVPAYLVAALAAFFYTLAARFAAPLAAPNLHAFAQSFTPHK